MMLKALFVVLAATLISLCHGRALQQQAHENWFDFGLADAVLDEVALYFLGQTWYQAADVAEVLETIHRTNNSDPWSWTMEWRETAMRLETLGDDEKVAGKQCGGELVTVIV